MGAPTVHWTSRPVRPYLKPPLLIHPYSVVRPLLETSRTPPLPLLHPHFQNPITGRPTCVLAVQPVVLAAVAPSATALGTDSSGTDSSGTDLTETQAPSSQTHVSTPRATSSQSQLSRLPPLRRAPTRHLGWGYRALQQPLRRCTNRCPHETAHSLVRHVTCLVS